MRCNLFVIVSVLATSLLGTSVAAAQGTPFGNGTNSKSSSQVDDEEVDPDVAQSYAARKHWAVGTSLETNRTVLQQDVGVGIKAFNTLSAYASYNLTRADQVRVTGGFIQRFIADETETGIRADDIGTSYSHRFRLPAGFMLASTLGNSIPISFQSRLMGLIALPRASMFVSRSFLDDNLNLSVSAGGAYYIVKYRQAEGREDANPRASTNVRFSVNYSMPFHQPLQIGGSVGTSYSWSYNVDHANDATLNEQFKNTPVEPSADPYFYGSPPARQNYSGEVYISYSLPSLVGVQTNLQVAVSQGDGVLREGATHLYWMSRRGGQMSAALTISY